MASINGFTTIVPKRIYLRDPEPSNLDQNGALSDPDTVVIFGWGDGLPKHVVKYADGYHALFPSSAVYMVITPIFTLVTQTLSARVASMYPLVDALFPPGQRATGDERILIHMMSNTGAVYGAAFIAAYQDRHGATIAPVLGSFLPHTLAVCDSTPGGLDFSKEVHRWARAMSLGLSPWFPWPASVTQGICRGMLTITHYAERARGEQMAGCWAKDIFNDSAIADERAGRLYLYSKEDDLIWWEDVEAAASLSKELGWRVFTETFEGTGHVAHMRKYPEKYWAAIGRSWKASVESKSEDEVEVNGEVKAAVESVTV